MVRTYKKKTNKGGGSAWSHEDMNEAIIAIENKTMSVRRAAMHFKVPKSTLLLKSRGWKGRQPTLNSKSGGQKITLPASEEEKLAKLMKTMSKWGFGLSKQELLNVVQEYVQKNNIPNHFRNGRPGTDWFKSFCSRHHLTLKKPELVEGSRARQSCDPFIIYDFFDQLNSIIEELNLQNKPESIYNCDESGFKSDPTTTKVVTVKGASAKRVTGGNARKTTTVLACVNANGDKMPPMILHKGKRIWDNMMGDTAFPGTSYAVSDNGWMTETVFTTWFKNQFLDYIKIKPALLIYDGHLSHISMELIQAAIEAEVTILKLPPHTSHILQPLDVSVFKGVKSKWDSLLAEWTKQNYGRQLPKNEFANILGKVWDSVNPDVIKKGFEKSGIFPINRLRLDQKNFDPDKLARFQNSIRVAGPCEAGTGSSTPGTPPPPRPSDIERKSITEGSMSSSIGSSSTISPSSSFESLLLKTVTPRNEAPAKKRRRVDNAEIITKDSYLQMLKDQETRNRKDAEVKVERKLKLQEERTESAKRKEKIKPAVKKVEKKKPAKIKPIQMSTRTSKRKKNHEKRCVF